MCIIFRDITTSGANQHCSTKSPSISDPDDCEGDDVDKEKHSSQPKKKALVSSNTTTFINKINLQINI